VTAGRFRLQTSAFALFRRLVHAARSEPRAPAELTRNSFPIWVEAPPYNSLSAGVRAMNLLCYHLNRLGYDAFISGPRPTHDAPIPLRYLTASIIEQQARQRRDPIIVYPEVTVGNPRQGKFVVRYLLNTPGFLVPGSERSFGQDDYFIDCAREHAPEGVRSFELFMPLVDRSIYFPPAAPSAREGFAIFTNRAAFDPAMLPDWVKPHTLVSMERPRSHAELAELYRTSRAMVVFERSYATFEALWCGCPVICIGNSNFREETYHPRFRGAGLVWGWQEQQLAEAAQQTMKFRTIYEDLERSLDERIQTAFDWILADVRRRLQTG
jgi:glycosyltransferase involved in cell wall biosynthesis